MIKWDLQLPEWGSVSTEYPIVLINEVFWNKRYQRATYYVGNVCGGNFNIWGEAEWQNLGFTEVQIWH